MGHVAPQSAPGPLISTLAEYALEIGLSAAQLEAETGLPIATLRSVWARPPELAIPALLLAIQRHDPVTVHTLPLSERVPLGALGVLVVGPMCAPSLRSAMELFIRFRALLSTRARFRLVEGPEVTRVEMEHPADELDLGLGAELGQLIVTRVLRDLMGLRDAVVALHWRYPAPGPDPEARRAAFEAHVGVPVAWDQPSNAVLLATETLDRPLAMQSAEVFKAVGRRLLAERDRVLGGRLPLRSAAERCAARGDFSASGLAFELGMSVRAAQRAAKEQGTTLTAVIEEGRHALACALLEGHEHTLDDVADKLGYASVRAFRRAFKRQTGVTPAAWRSDARSQG